MEKNLARKTKPTLFMHHSKNKSYHVDYCFASKEFKLENVGIGKYADWAKKSVHMPLIITVINQNSKMVIGDKLSIKNKYNLFKFN